MKNKTNKKRFMRLNFIFRNRTFIKGTHQISTALVKKKIPHTRDTDSPNKYGYKYRYKKKPF